MKALPNYTTRDPAPFAPLTVDGNNRVLACNVFYAGGNGGVWSKGLWPHSWSLYVVGPQPLSAGGKTVFDYQVTDMGSGLELGTFCHENGHMLCGYPDLYDYDYDSKGGAGMFCLMGSGRIRRQPLADLRLPETGLGLGHHHGAQRRHLPHRPSHGHSRARTSITSTASRSPACPRSITCWRTVRGPAGTRGCRRRGSPSGTSTSWATTTTRAPITTPPTPTTN